MPDLTNWPTARLLSTAARLVEHVWDEQLASLGLTHAGVIALEVLDAGGPMAQAQIAASVRVQAQTMGKTLSRLEAHGHITRVRNPSGGRSHQITVSELGKTVLGQAKELERNLTSGADVGADQLRDRLADVIRRLGSARWAAQAPTIRAERGERGFRIHLATRFAAAHTENYGQGRTQERDKRPHEQAGPGARAVAVSTGKDQEKGIGMYDRKGDGDAGDGIPDQLL